ncbi:hypothetical protein SDC9_180689 [bioreactor metagenome]|uniref:Uncharacterized protein n=1 Tax=bioreactor metagenome TaxID=1076179 RepID=A0A645H2F4_9ZZZZ
MQFIRFDEYGRKLTLLTSTVGVIGVLIAVYIVKSLNLAWLQWVVAIVIVYAAITLIIELGKKKAA